MQTLAITGGIGISGPTLSQEDAVTHSRRQLLQQKCVGIDLGQKPHEDEANGDNNSTESVTTLSRTVQSLMCRVLSVMKSKAGT